MALPAGRWASAAPRLRPPTQPLHAAPHCARPHRTQPGYAHAGQPSRSSQHSRPWAWPGPGPHQRTAPRRQPSKQAGAQPHWPPCPATAHLPPAAAPGPAGLIGPMPHNSPHRAWKNRCGHHCRSRRENHARQAASIRSRWPAPLCMPPCAAATATPALPHWPTPPCAPPCAEHQPLAAQALPWPAPLCARPRMQPAAGIAPRPTPCSARRAANACGARPPAGHLRGHSPAMPAARPLSRFLRRPALRGKAVALLLAGLAACLGKPAHNKLIP